jgi:hypothetical protein
VKCTLLTAICLSTCIFCDYLLTVDLLTQWGVCKKFCGAPVPASPPPTELVSVEFALAPQLPPGALEFVHSPW